MSSHPAQALCAARRDFATVEFRVRFSIGGCLYRHAAICGAPGNSAMCAFRRSLTLGLLALVCAAAHSATFCVATSTELQQALTTAGSNGEDDVIKIRAGTYSASTGATAFAYFTSENHALSVQGGYFSVGQFPCLLQGLDASRTVLSGSNARRVMDLSAANGSSGNLSISNLTIRDGASTQQGGGLKMADSAGFVGNVTVERVIFDSNLSATFGGGLLVASDGGLLNVRNNLFLGNRCSGNNCAISATANVASGVRAYFGGNTIVANACAAGAPATCNVGGVRIGGSAHALFYNNAFAFNTGTDLAIQAPNVEVYNNNINVITGTPSMSSGNLALSDPVFVNPFAGDYRLQLASPLRNAGIGTYELSSVDLDGNERVNEGVVDIGAYENTDIVFRDGFELIP
jgi:hypothetical protein